MTPAPVAGGPVPVGSVTVVVERIGEPGDKPELLLVETPEAMGTFCDPAALPLPEAIQRFPYCDLTPQNGKKLSSILRALEVERGDDLQPGVGAIVSLTSEYEAGCGPESRAGPWGHGSCATQSGDYSLTEPGEGDRQFSSHLQP